MAQLEGESPEFRGKVSEFLDSLISHYVLDDGKLVVARRQEGGNARAWLWSRSAIRQVRGTTGETDEFGLPVRYNWAADYRGKAMVVYGHAPVTDAQWLNRTIDIDTGCVFGGKLTVLRYPEKELACVPAHHTYYEPAKPLAPA